MGVSPTEEVTGLLSPQDDLELDDISQRTLDAFSDCRLLRGFAQLLHKPGLLDRRAALPKGVSPIRNALVRSFADECPEAVSSHRGVITSLHKCGCSIIVNELKMPTSHQTHFRTGRKSFG